jgi:uncharacterized protein
MPRRIESLFIAGPAGRLEALLEEPEHEDPVEAALLCHPHPQHGGTMHNKVIYRLARGLRKTGRVVLRFNYRGVNLSEGEYDHGQGEIQDARVCLEELRSRYPHLPAMIAGFSFGSRIALKTALAHPVLTRAIAVGYPTTYKNREYINHITMPKIFIQSTNDVHGPRADFEPFFAALPEPKRMLWVEAADHFFKDALDAYEQAVVQSVSPEEP